MRTRITALAAIVLSVVLAACPAGLALASDGVGNEFSSAETGTGSPRAERDFVWVGQTARFTDLDVGSDVLAAGQDVSFSGGKAGGSIRVASQTIGITDVKAKGNVTAAGQTIVIDGNAAAAGVYLVAQDIRLGGKAACAMVVAATVVFDGVISGDVYVRADTVRFNPGARVKGTAFIASPNQPYIDPAADVASIKYTQVESASIDGGAIEDAAAVLSSASLAFGVFAIVALVVCVLLVNALVPRMGQRLAELFTRRTGAFIAAGVLGALLLPAAAVILCLLVVTLPLGLLLFAFMAAGPLFAPIVAAAGLGRLCFPNMNRWGSGALFAAIVGVLLMVPFVKWVVRFAVLALATGFILLAIAGRSGGKAELAQRSDQPQFTGPVPPEL